MTQQQKNEFPGLKATGVIGMLAFIVGSAATAITYLRGVYGVFPILSEQGAKLSYFNAATIHSVWWKMSVTVAVAGLLIAIGTGILQKVIGHYAPAIAKNVEWMRYALPGLLIVACLGAFGIPMSMELAAKHEGHVNHLEEIQRASQGEQAALAFRQQWFEAERIRAEAKAKEINEQIDILISGNTADRSLAVQFLSEAYQLRQPDQFGVFAPLKDRLLKFAANRGPKNFQNVRVVATFASVLNGLQAGLGTTFQQDWADHAEERIDIHSPDFVNLLRESDDPKDLARLKQYCESIGKDAVAGDRRLKSMLQNAVSNSVPGVVNLLLDEGGQANAMFDGMDGSLLCLTCERIAGGASTDVMKALLSHGSNPDAQNTWGTPLGIMLRFHKKNAIHLLLEAKADPNYEDRNGGTPFYQAVLTRDTDVALDMIRHGARSQEGVPMLQALRYGDSEVVAALLDNKAAANDPKEGKETPLSVAIATHSATIVSLLLAHGADIRSLPASHVPYLLQAAWSGDAAVVSAFVAAHTSVDVQDAKSDTALHVAVKHQNSEIVKVLIEANANVNIPDSTGTTPLMSAVREANLLLVNELLMAKAEPNAVDHEGHTALDGVDFKNSTSNAELVALLKSHHARHSN